MSLIKIMNRFAYGIIYSGEHANIRAAVIACLNAGVNLHGADLPRANLAEADLSGANLSRADLSGADLSGASLYGANLYGANLHKVNLFGADLSEANLSEANLSGADLRMVTGLNDKYKCISISPIGSDNACLFAMRDENGILKLSRGCFKGTVDEFLSAVTVKHGDNQCALEYRAAVELIKIKFGVK